MMYDDEKRRPCIVMLFASQTVIKSFEEITMLAQCLI